MQTSFFIPKLFYLHFQKGIFFVFLKISIDLKVKKGRIWKYKNVKKFHAFYVEICEKKLEF